MAENRFLKVNGGFEREPVVLSEEQRRLYFQTEGQKPNPLSPTAFLQNLQGTPQVDTQGTAPVILTGGGTGAGAGGGVPEAPSPQNQYDDFNFLLLDALKKSQGLGTADLLKRKRDLERASLGRAGEITPEGLRTLSPEQQASIRSGDVGALRPDIDETAFQIKKAEQSVANFERVFSEASKLGEEFQKNMVAPDSVIQLYKQLIEADPSRIATALQGLNDKTRQKVIENLDYTKMQPKEDLKTVDLGDRVGFFDKAGNLIKSEPKGKLPGTPSSITLPSTKKTALLGAGFTEQEVISIENDVRQFGVRAVLENKSLTDSQREAIAEAYDAFEVLFEIDEESTPKAKGWWETIGEIGENILERGKERRK